MQRIFIVLTGWLLCSAFAQAQDTVSREPARPIHYRWINKDSVQLSLNRDFELIEDSCATIIRYAHLDTASGKFVGRVRDVSKADPNIIITDGTYDKEGNKQGLFVSNFLNGKLQSKGSFVNDKFDGKWELYYDDGKPRMNFEVHGNDIQLNNYWDAAGTKVIDNGRGKYKFEVAQIYWEGHLLNGRPAGTWFAYKISDGAQIITEIYKLGVFQIGKSPSGKEYKDAARMELVSTDLLPFTHAEALRPSVIPCGIAYRNIVHPQYKDGMQAYNSILSDNVAVALESIDLKRYNNKSFSITGVVDDNGFLTNLEAIDSFDANITRKLLDALKRSPALSPTMRNGHRVKVTIQVDFVIKGGFCRFNYTFGSIEN